MKSDPPQLAFLLDPDPLETEARLRELRAVAALICGWTHPVTLALGRAIEDGPAAVGEALAAVDALPAKTRRRVLATSGALWNLVKIRTAGCSHLELDDGRCPRCGL